MSRLLTNSLFQVAVGGVATASWSRVRLGDSGVALPEAWLRDLIRDQPELVLGPCRSFGFIDDDESWKVWSPELAVPGVGNVDIALVSAEGRVALVEVKLARNPENRRKVVAQLLDYAIHLREVTIGDLPDLPEDVHEDDVQHHLRAGDFLLVVAADEADPRAAKLTRTVLDRHAIHPWELALIDLALFEPVGRDHDGTSLVCAPHVVGGVQCESRHVVEVKVSTATERPSVEVQLAEPEVTVVRSRTWDRESFQDTFPALARNAMFSSIVMEWIQSVESSHETEIRYGKGKHPTVNFCSSRVAFASAERNGVWVQGRDVLKEAFGDVVGGQRWNQIRALFPEQPDSKPYFLVGMRDSRLSDAVAIIRTWNRQ